MTAPRPSTLGVYLRLARISNLPTLVGPALVGWAIARTSAGAAPAAADLALTIAALMLFYTAGMVLNDVADAKVDAQQRPGRPIPAGDVRRGSALAFALALFILGFVCVLTAAERSIAAVGAAAALTLCITAYDLLHERSAAAVILMGACRALCYPLATLMLLPAAIAPATTDAPGTGAQPLELALIAGAAVGVYTAGFSLIARSEHINDRPRLWPIAWALPAAAMLPLTAAFPLLPVLAAAGALALWCVLPALIISRPRPRIGRAVHLWIAGFALLDACLLGVLGQWTAAGIALTMVPLTMLSHRFIRGT